jgi:hypothetical protein
VDGNPRLDRNFLGSAFAAAYPAMFAADGPLFQWSGRPRGLCGACEIRRQLSERLSSGDGCSSVGGAVAGQSPLRRCWWATRVVTIHDR